MLLAGFSCLLVCLLSTIKQPNKQSIEASPEWDSTSLKLYSTVNTYIQDDGHRYLNRNVLKCYYLDVDRNSKMSTITKYE